LNGLSFVWTGDGKPDQLTAKYAKGCDVFVTEMAVDMVNLWALKQGVPPIFGALTIDIHHTPHYAFGYLANLIQPRLAMATHVSFDKELIGEMTAGVRMHYKGMFAFGIDHTVVNVTKDPLDVSGVPETANARPNTVDAPGTVRRVAACFPPITSIRTTRSRRPRSGDQAEAFTKTSFARKPRGPRT
jgi:hypothetical protein